MGDTSSGVDAGNEGRRAATPLQVDHEPVANVSGHGRNQGATHWEDEDNAAIPAQATQEAPASSFDAAKNDFDPNDMEKLLYDDIFEGLDLPEAAIPSSAEGSGEGGDKTLVADESGVKPQQQEGTNIYSHSSSLTMDPAMLANFTELGRQAATLPFPHGRLDPLADARLLGSITIQALDTLQQGLTHVTAQPSVVQQDAALQGPTPHGQETTDERTTAASDTSANGSVLPSEPHPADPFVCKKCKGFFADRSKLQTHIVKAHSPPSLLFLEVQGWARKIRWQKETRKIPEKKTAGGKTIPEHDETGYFCPKCPYDSYCFEYPANFRRHVRACQIPTPDPREGPGSYGSPPTTQITLRMIQEMIRRLEEKNPAYLAPQTKTQSPFLQRAGFANLLEGQDVKKLSRLLRLPSDHNSPSEAQDDETEILAASERALFAAADLLRMAPPYYAQALGVTKLEDARVSRPMNASEATLAKYVKVLQRLLIFLVRLFVKLYEPESDWMQPTPDFDNFLPRPHDENDGWVLPLRALERADSTLKSALGRLLRDKSDEAVWEVGSFLFTSAFPDRQADSLLHIFTALLAIKEPGSGEFYLAREYTPLLSCLIYDQRLCWFAQVITELGEHQDNEAVRQYLAETKKTADQYRVECFQERHKAELTSENVLGSGGSMLLSLRTFARACAVFDAVRARTQWDAEGQSLFLDAHLITMASVHNMMSHIISSVEDRLQDLLSLSHQGFRLDTLPLHKFTDDASWAEVGAWFGAIPGNAALFDLERYANELLPSLIDVSEAPDKVELIANVDEDAADDLLKLEEDFLKALLVAIHTTSGMPCRGSELLETTYKDGAGTRPRSVLISPGGEVMLDLTWNKMEYNSSRLKQNIRFLQPTVARILVLYLLTVRPLTDAVFRLRHGMSRPYLWSRLDVKKERCEPWDSKVLSRHLGYASARSGVGLELNINRFRHLAEAIAHRHFRTGRLRGFLNQHFLNTHRPQDESALMGYDVTMDDIEEFAEDAEEALVGFSATHKATRQAASDLFADQSNRTLQSSWMYYARQKSHRAGMDDDNIENGRLASRVLQEFFGIGPSSSASSASLQPTGPGNAPMPHLVVGAAVPFSSVEQSVLKDDGARILQPASVPSVELITGTAQAFAARMPLSLKVQRMLVQVVPDLRGIRSHSIADALQLMETGCCNIGLVAPTGAGKSLVWKVSTAMRQGQASEFTLLITPYNALKEDILKTCAEENIQVQTWQDAASVNIPIGQPNLLLVSLNQAVSQPFLSWLATPLNSDRVSRVIMDEAHVLLDERSFRQCVARMANLCSLLRHKRFIFMSATIPPAAEVDFQSMTLLPVTFKRDLTHRANLSYSIERYSTPALLISSIKARIVMATRPEHGPDSQVLVIAKTQKKALRYAQQLGCKAFFSAKVDQEPDISATNDFDANLQEYLRGETNIIVGTTALGVGVNRPAIRLVICIDEPYSMVSFAQCSGRAGRDGKPANVVIYLPSRAAPQPAFNVAARTDQEAVRQLVGGTICMRVPMGAWLDGRASTCFELDADRCSKCIHHLGRASAGPSTDPGGHGGGDDDDDDSDHGDDADDGDGTRDGDNTSHAVEDPSAYAPKVPSTSSAKGKSKEISERALEKRKAPEIPLSPTLKRIKHQSRAPTHPSWPMDSDDEDDVPIGVILERSRRETGGSTEASSSRHPPSSGRIPASGASAAASQAASSPDGPASTPTPAARIGLLTKGITLRDILDIGGSVPKKKTSILSADVLSRPPFLSLRQPSLSSPPAESISTSEFSARLQSSGTSTFSSELAALSASAQRAELRGRLADMTSFRQAVLEALTKARRECPMCHMLGRPNDHAPGFCQAQHLRMQDQIDFRKNGANEWRYGSACFKCNLPQDICRRDNNSKSCEFAEYKDAIRGILMLLTAYPPQLAAAIEAATLVNPNYQLPNPSGLLRMGEQWRTVDSFLGLQMYKAFQAVAAVLFLFAGYI
ncbi:hypothetical protein OC842_002379 [Tilletia horrida]|uniref:DNA 3'-5' helicase n=1 Tax=Tilletia horrida TaxID=155126 RepID=A0AAN6GDE0_9BASI|nr:hypothetical protein OC842_002379 [Tilletia horrida]